MLKYRKYRNRSRLEGLIDGILQVVDGLVTLATLGAGDFGLSYNFSLWCLRRRAFQRKNLLSSSPFTVGGPHVHKR